MTQSNLGNQLYEIVDGAKAALFEQGELAQLTYGAFDIAARALDGWDQDEISVSFPIGYSADKQPITTNRSYRKAELLGRYQFLAFEQLAVNGVIQLVTITDAMLGDIVRAVVLRYPGKLGGKRQIPMQDVLQAQSVEEIHLRATDLLLNDLSYKSPAEFAQQMEAILAVNLLECPAFHKYIEIKATRDIHVHNRGIANDIYVRKAGSHARVTAGTRLPVDIQYFLESYEACLQVTEWLERELHSHWHSTLYEESQQKQIELPLPPSTGRGLFGAFESPSVDSAPDSSTSS